MENKWKNAEYENEDIIYIIQNGINEQLNAWINAEEMASWSKRWWSKKINIC